MFGYVKPYTPELKMIENQYYRAAYCGLCRALRDEIGMLSRMTLSYDITFLVLASLSLAGEIPEFDKKRCFLHPLKKRLVMKKNETLIFASHVSALLTYYKIKDDVTDEKGLKKVSAFFLKLLFSRSYKKAKKGYEELDLKIKEHLEDLRSIERERTRSADRPAAIFGALMSDVLAYMPKDEERKRIGSVIGASVGRWIYLIDALDDIERDRKAKSYNPFILLFDGAELDREKKLDIKAAMLSVLGKASSAFDLLDFDGRRDLEGLIRNILTEGMPRMTDAVLFGTSENETKITYENGEF